MNYYNEIEPYAVQWLRNLQRDGRIPTGKVDERSIVDVKAEDLRGGVTQAHFFAGIAGWSHALKLAGWPEGREVWTGSCPCQPFSVAGGRKGTEDKRHLWPDFFRLIKECLPSVVFGEQVASKDGRDWLVGVRADLESVGYEVGAADLCAAGTGEIGEGWILRGSNLFREGILIGAPHIRQRLFWVAHASSRKSSNGGVQRSGQHGLLQEDSRPGERTPSSVGTEEVESFGRMACSESVGYRANGMEPESGRRECPTGSDDVDVAGRLADGTSNGRLEERQDGRRGDGRAGTEGRSSRPGLCGTSSGMVDAENHGPESRSQLHGEHDREVLGDGRKSSRMADCPDKGLDGGLRKRQEEARGREPGTERRGSVGGFWGQFDLVPCADRKARRVEPGTFPLAHGVPARVGKLRAYGNAIVPPLAAEFIKAYLEVFPT